MVILSALFVPTLETNIDESYILTVENDTSQFENSSIVFQPLWEIGQVSKTYTKNKTATYDGNEYDASTTNVKRVTTEYLYKIHWMILLVFTLFYISICKTFYTRH